MPKHLQCSMLGGMLQGSCHVNFLQSPSGKLLYVVGVLRSCAKGFGVGGNVCYLVPVPSQLLMVMFSDQLYS